MGHHRSKLCIPWIMVFLVGCGDGVETPLNTSLQPTTDNIRGTIVDIHVTDTGEVERKHNATSASVAAFLPGENGQLTRVDGVVSDDGTFAIPNVPAGNYYLRLERTDIGTTVPTTIWLLTAERSMDLGSVTYGRPDAVPLQTDTMLHFNIEGLASFQDTDTLELFSGGAAVQCLLPPPMAGETTAIDTWSLLNCGHSTGAPPAIEATKGDRTFITQFVRQGDPDPDLGESFISLRKAFVSDSLQVIDGNEVMLAGTASDVPQKNINLSVDGASFEASAADVHPNAAIEDNFRLLVITGTTWLLDYASKSFNGALTSFDYGNPYPSRWLERYSMGVNYSMQLTVPGGMGPKVVTASINRVGPVSSIPTTKLEPSVSPPREIQINGQPAVADLSSAGTTPTISWSAPSKGTAEGYLVTVRRIDPMNFMQNVGTIYTTETSVTLPPGFLDVGSYYYIRIRAYDHYDPKAPFMPDNERRGYAEALTGLITP